MNGGLYEIESPLGLFSEYVKHRGSPPGCKTMEDRGNDGWFSNDNLVHNIIKRSRSEMSTSDDGTLQFSGKYI